MKTDLIAAPPEGHRFVLIREVAQIFGRLELLGVEIVGTVTGVRFVWWIGAVRQAAGGRKVFKDSRMRITVFLSESATLISNWPSTNGIKDFSARKRR